MIYLSLLALIAGAAIATQTSMNAQLGIMLKNPLLATSVAFVSSIFFTLCGVLLVNREIPSMEMVRAVPVYLWFAGGAFSAFGLGCFYYLIPKMGIGAMLSAALTGQLLLAVIAGHFGWFDLPVKPITAAKLAGVAALVSGIVLINRA
ncbi:DMT family transporter [Thalassomonas viridans]|uniref:DMT family transporter n=1 Tax=Thalassomonas viridans TaxID=137584 RepID=A0AAF0C7H3_9GAMM|nr:DMT family transporter [Thalassomonas viridans]WDE03346.1 DMT family transporter [Thalassomonas viridans]